MFSLEFISPGLFLFYITFWSFFIIFLLLLFVEYIIKIPILMFLYKLIHDLSSSDLIVLIIILLVESLRNIPLSEDWE